MQTKGEKEKVKSEEEERWRREENKVELLVFTLSFFKCLDAKVDHLAVTFSKIRLDTNEPFWPRLKVRTILYFAHANEVRKPNYNTYKRIY